MSFVDYLTETKTKKVKKRRIFVDPLFVLRSHNIKIKSFKPLKDGYAFETYEELDLKLLKSFKTKKIDNLTYYVQTSNLNY